MAAYGQAMIDDPPHAGETIGGLLLVGAARSFGVHGADGTNQPFPVRQTVRQPSDTVIG
jgi:hypothetical protein